MMTLNRRALLGSTALVAMALAGCGTNAATVDAQVVADVQGLVPETQAIINAINQYAPNAISAANQQKIASLEQAAIAAAQSLSASMPTASAAAALQQAESYLMTGLQIIGAALPSASAAFPALLPFVPLYDSAVALLPGILAYVNSLGARPASMSAASAPKAMHPGVSPTQARTLLHIPAA